MSVLLVCCGELLQGVPSILVSEFGGVSLALNVESWVLVRRDKEVV